MSESNTKIAIITGGSRGLGRNTALAAAARGIDVIFTYRSNKAEAEKVGAEIKTLGRKALALQLDTGDTASFPAFADTVTAALRDTWGRTHFDYLVNNAGHAASGSVAEMTEADFDGLYRVHLKGVAFLTQKLLPLIADGGRIVNLSSGLARFSLPGYAAYAAMKGAIEVFTRYLAKEVGPRGIAVNVVAPGAIETDFGGGAVRDNADINKFVASVTAMGRVGVPDDIGPMIANLLADENRWLTGQRIEVSGGMFV
jgi:NAD(P)-dependent dehydrogenase (short-subunit alcohol dehydrogenase family)